MELRVITDAQELESLEQDWDALLRESSGNALPVSHSWIMAWWNSFGGGNCELHVVVVYGDNQELLAIAPFMKARTAFRGVKVIQLSLMANSYTPSVSIVVRRNVDPDAVVAIVFQHLIGLRGVDVITLKKLPSSGDVYDAVIRHLRATRQLFGVKRIAESPFIPTTTDWDTFVAPFSRNFRKEIRSRLKAANGCNGIEVKRIKIQNSADPAFDDIRAISANSWKRAVGTHIDGWPDGKRFLLDLCDRFGSDGAVSIWLLCKDHLPIAYEFHVTYGGVTYPLRADYRSALARVAPGATLECQILRALFDDPNVREYNTCGNTYRYLLRWTNLTRKHVHIQVFPKRFLPRSLYLFEFSVIPSLRWARRILERLRVSVHDRVNPSCALVSPTPRTTTQAAELNRSVREG